MRRNRQNLKLPRTAVGMLWSSRTRELPIRQISVIGEGVPAPPLSKLTSCPRFGTLSLL